MEFEGQSNTTITKTIINEVIEGLVSMSIIQQDFLNILNWNICPLLPISSKQPFLDKLSNLLQKCQKNSQILQKFKHIHKRNKKLSSKKQISLNIDHEQIRNELFGINLGRIQDPVINRMGSIKNINELNKFKQPLNNNTQKNRTISSIGCSKEKESLDLSEASCTTPKNHFTKNSQNFYTKSNKQQKGIRNTTNLFTIQKNASKTLFHNNSSTKLIQTTKINNKEIDDIKKSLQSRNSYYTKSISNKSSISFQPFSNSPNISDTINNKINLLGHDTLFHKTDTKKNESCLSGKSISINIENDDNGNKQRKKLVKCGINDFGTSFKTNLFMANKPNEIIHHSIRNQVKDPEIYSKYKAKYAINKSRYQAMRMPVREDHHSQQMNYGLMDLELADGKDEETPNNKTFVEYPELDITKQEQKATIQKHLEQFLKDSLCKKVGFCQNPDMRISNIGELGESKYLIDFLWWKAWVDYVDFYEIDSRNNGISSKVRDKPGPISNKIMIKGFMNLDDDCKELPLLKPGLFENQDYIALDQSSFSFLKNQYTIDHIIERTQIKNTNNNKNGKDKELFLDLYPKFIKNTLIKKGRSSFSVGRKEDDLQVDRRLSCGRYDSRNNDSKPVQKNSENIWCEEDQGYLYDIIDISGQRKINYHKKNDSNCQMF